LERGSSSAVGRGRAGSERPRPTALLPPCSHGKPETATAVYKLLMIGMNIPETCWSVFKRQAINLRDWCSWLVDLFEYMMMHGLTNHKRLILFSITSSTLLQTTFIISSDILWTNVLMYLTIQICFSISFTYIKKLPEVDKDKSKHVGITTNCAFCFVLFCFMNKRSKFISQYHVGNLSFELTCNVKIQGHCFIWIIILPLPLQVKCARACVRVRTLRWLRCTRWASRQNVINDMGQVKETLFVT
jgi:hypothetical protein